jgi:hypothetical protein
LFDAAANTTVTGALAVGGRLPRNDDDPMTTPAIPEAGTLPWLDRYTSTSGEIMTEVGVTQAQLLEFGREWERRCWPILAEEVETLRAEVARLERLAYPAQVRCGSCLQGLHEECSRCGCDCRHGHPDIPEWESDLLLSQAMTERDQARADLAALHAEAARLRAALDLVERDKAHELVDELMAERNTALDQRDQWKYNAGIWENNRHGWHRRALEAEDERDAMRPVVEHAVSLVISLKTWGEEARVNAFAEWPGLVAAATAYVDQMAPSGPHVPPVDDPGDKT